MYCTNRQKPSGSTRLKRKEKKRKRKVKSMRCMQQEVRMIIEDELACL